MSRNWSANVSMVYWIATAMGHAKPNYAKACKLADHFGFQELNRIYRAVKGKRSPHALVELIGATPNNVVALRGVGRGLNTMYVADTLIIRKAA